MTNAAVYKRENSNGYYCTSAYFFSHILIGIPLNIVVCTMFSTMLFYFVNIANGDWNQFPTFLLVNYLTMETYIGLNELIGILSPNFEFGIALAGICSNLQVTNVEQASWT